MSSASAPTSLVAHLRSRAVKAAQKAYDTVWGVKCPAHERGKLLIALAEAIEANKAELAAIEALDNGASSGRIQR